MKYNIKNTKEIKTYWRKIKDELQWGNIMRWALILGAVLLYIDVHNLLLNKIFVYGWTINCLIGTVIIVFISTFIVEYKVWQLFRILDLNIIDKGIFLALFTNLLYIFGIYLFEIVLPYKIIVFCIGIVLLLLRICFYYYKLNELKEQKEETNIFDLKDICDNKFELEGRKICLLGEKDVDYDLLGRDNIINTLYQVITEIRAKEKFVISLEGKWGSGKSTIINNVKKRIKDGNKEIVIIDNFDPWNYVDRESLFTNMVNEILKKSEYPQAELKMNKTIIKFRKAIFGSQKYTSWLNCLLEDDKNNVEDLKEKINNHLKEKNKRIVFFIDNIERMDSENVILLFKIVGNLLSFDKVVYLLSFDDSKIKEIFDQKKEMKNEYLKKIIQMQIRMPEIDRNISKALYNRCLTNVLNKLFLKWENEKEKSKDLYECFEKSIYNMDLRNFKRFINSVLSVVSSGIDGLNKVELIVLNYLKTKNINLYYEIYNNRKYFISYDEIEDIAVLGAKISKDEYKEKEEKYFENLFKNLKNKEEKELLGKMFPNIEWLASNVTQIDIETKNKVAMNNCISSAKYFNQYFTDTSNAFIYISEQVNKLIEEINKANLYEDKKEIFETKLNKLDEIYQKEFFERIELNLSKLKKGVVSDVLNIIFENLYTLNEDSNIFTGLSAQTRGVIIMRNLIIVVNDDEFEVFVQKLQADYKNIGIIRNIIYWIKNNKERAEEGIEKERLEKIKEIYREMRNNIIKNKIDIYENKNYDCKKNTGPIIWAIVDAGEIEPLKSYFKRILNSQNIFRFINDNIQESTISGGIYRYKISDYLIEKEFSQPDESSKKKIITKAEINGIIKDLKPKNEDEKFILAVWKDSLNDGTGIKCNKKRTIKKTMYKYWSSKKEKA